MWLYETSLVYGLALALWLLPALAMPALERRWGWPGLRVGIAATVLSQGVAAVLTSAAAWSLAELGKATLGVLACGWLAEYVGVTTGLPFGAYTYTPQLQPQVGSIPVLVALAYVPILIPAWGTADLLVGGSRGPEFVFAGAIAATAWDLLLDPQLVRWGVWRWQSRGGYFGIPWRNYLGWLAVTGAMTSALPPDRLNPQPLAVLYSAACVLEVIALSVLWPCRGPAIVGGVVMGAVAILAWLRVLL
jgi:putative membrane protein